MDIATDFRFHADGLTLEHSQVITQDFLDELQNERAAKRHVRMGEFNRVASIPTLVVELWERQGFYLDEHTTAEIVQRLRRHDLHAFLATEASV